MTPEPDAGHPDGRRIQPSDVKRRLERLLLIGFRGAVHIHFAEGGIRMIREEHSARTAGELREIPHTTPPVPPPAPVRIPTGSP